MSNNSTSNTNKLGGKDLITIGIFTVIYFICIGVFGGLGVIPIFVPLTAVFCPLIGGIPYMLYVTKVKKFGMITIMGVLIGLLLTLMGMGYWAVILGAVAGLLADLIMKSGNYKSTKKAILSCGVFALWDFGNLMPFYVGRESYFATLAERFSEDYCNTLASYFPTWSAILFVVCCFVCGIIGGYIGKAICRKHFERAGIV